MSENLQRCVLHALAGMALLSSGCGTPSTPTTYATRATHMPTLTLYETVDGKTKPMGNFKVPEDRFIRDGVVVRGTNYTQVMIAGEPGNIRDSLADINLIRSYGAGKTLLAVDGELSIDLIDFGDRILRAFTDGLFTNDVINVKISNTNRWVLGCFDFSKSGIRMQHVRMFGGALRSTTNGFIIMATSAKTMKEASKKVNDLRSLAEKANFTTETGMMGFMTHVYQYLKSLPAREDDMTTIMEPCTISCFNSDNTRIGDFACGYERLPDGSISPTLTISNVRIAGAGRSALICDDLSIKMSDGKPVDSPTQIPVLVAKGFHSISAIADIAGSGKGGTAFNLFDKSPVSKAGTGFFDYLQAVQPLMGESGEGRTPVVTGGQFSLFTESGVLLCVFGVTASGFSWTIPDKARADSAADMRDLLQGSGITINEVRAEFFEVASRSATALAADNMNAFSAIIKALDFEKDGDAAYQTAAAAYAQYMAPLLGGNEKSMCLFSKGGKPIGTISYAQDTDGSYYGIYQRQGARSKPVRVPKRDESK